MLLRIYNAGRARSVRQASNMLSCYCRSLLHHEQNDTPETTIGHQVSMTGELVFDKLLRIDGKFNGKLISKGDLIVGPTGVLTGNVLDMGEVSYTDSY
jgi:Polymer-forming cytoskeletal